ncbi:MAG TPA: DUF3995 domain-containing protein [Micromonosporaceae bacterium]|jgi:hypothetical protein
MQISHIAAIVVASVLGLDALIHVYWLTGRVWPARDTRALSQAVLNADVPFTPRVLLPLVLVLTIGGTAVLARADLVHTGLPSWVLAASAGAVALGLLARGLAGVAWIVGIGASRETPFYWLNLTAYTPVCLVLSVAAGIVAMHPGTA